MTTNIVMINIKGVEYKVRFTIGFWKKIQEVCQVNRSNMQQRLNEDFGNVATNIIYWGIKYGNNEGSTPEINTLEEELDASVSDVIEQAIIAGMTKAEKEMVELAKKQRDAKIKELEEEIGQTSKKKLP